MFTLISRSSFLVFGLLLFSTDGHAAPIGRSEAPQQAVLLKTTPGSGMTELVIQPLQQEDVAPPSATLAHLPDANIRGVLVDSVRQVVAVVADMRPGPDRSWSASLCLMAPGERTIELMDGVYTGIPPIIMEDGRLVVSRGVAGSPPAIDPKTGRPHHFRVDDIWLDAIDPQTGEIETLSRYQGYQVYPIGSRNDAIFAYRLNPEGAEIVAIDINNGQSHPLVSSMPPFARDFSFDTTTGVIAYTQRAVDNVDRWEIQTIDTQTGVNTTVVTTSSMAMTPRALPGGGIVYHLGSQEVHVQWPGAKTDEARSIHLHAIQRESTAHAARFEQQSNRLETVEDIRTLSADGTTVGVLQTAPGQLAVPWVADLTTGEMKRIPVENRVRVDIMGVTK